MLYLPNIFHPRWMCERRTFSQILLVQNKPTNYLVGKKMIHNYLCDVIYESIFAYSSRNRVNTFSKNFFATRSRLWSNLKFELPLAFFVGLNLLHVHTDGIQKRLRECKSNLSRASDENSQKLFHFISTIIFARQNKLKNHVLCALRSKMWRYKNL